MGHKNWGTWVKKHGQQILGPAVHDKWRGEVIQQCTGIILQEGLYLIESEQIPGRQWTRHAQLLGGQKKTRMDKSRWMATPQKRIDRIWQKSESLAIPNLVRQEFLRLLRHAVKKWKKTFRTGMTILIYIAWHAVAGITWQQFEQATGIRITHYSKRYIDWAKTIDPRYDAPRPTAYQDRYDYFKAYYKRPKVQKRYKEHRAKNAEKRKAWFQIYYSDPANKKRHKENCARWERENREYRKLYQRKWNAKNIEKKRRYARESYRRCKAKRIEYAKRWNHRNKNRVNQKRRERYARRTT